MHRQRPRRHLKGGHDGAVIRWPRVHREGHFRAALFAGELGGRRLRRPRRVDEVDPVLRLVPAGVPPLHLGPPRPPGQPEALERVRMYGAPGVGEAGRLHRPAHRPVHHVLHVVPRADHLFRVVPPRRRIEIADEERGDAPLGQRRQHLELGLDVRQAVLFLGGQDLLDGRAAAYGLRAGVVGREVHVGQRDPAPRGELDKDVVPLGPRRREDRIPRDDLRRVAPVRVAGRLGQLAPCWSPLPRGRSTSGCACFTASTTLAKLTWVPPYSTLNSMTFSVMGEADGAGDGPAPPGAAAGDEGETKRQDQGGEQAAGTWKNVACGPVARAHRDCLPVASRARPGARPLTIRRGERRSTSDSWAK